MNEVISPCDVMDLSNKIHTRSGLLTKDLEMTPELLQCISLAISYAHFAKEYKEPDRAGSGVAMMASLTIGLSALSCLAWVQQVTSRLSAAYGKKEVGEWLGSAPHNHRLFSFQTMQEMTKDWTYDPYLASKGHTLH